MIKCPFCAEEIEDESTKCKYCDSMLESAKLIPKTQGILLGTIIGLAVIAFVLLGIWASNQSISNPHQGKSTKTTITSSSDKNEKTISTVTQVASNKKANNTKSEKVKFQKDTVVSDDKFVIKPLSKEELLNIVKKYMLSASELNSIWEKVSPTYSWWYEYVSVERDESVSNLFNVSNIYRIMYQLKENISTEDTGAEFFIRVYIFSGKPQLDIAKSYFVSAVSEYGITPHIKDYFVSGFKKRYKVDKEYLGSDCSYDYTVFYSEKDNILIEIACTWYPPPLSRAISKYIERLGLTWLNPYPDENLSDPKAAVHFVLETCKRKDVSSYRKLQAPDSIYRDTLVAAAKLLGKVASEDGEYPRVRYDLFDKITKSSKKNFSLTNLGTEYIMPDLLSVLRGLVGPNNIANILVINNNEPSMCIILIKKNDKWIIFDNTDVPEELQQIMRKL